MGNHNREVEYRKIPSTKFMYEVSADGRHVRNIKSKRELQQLKRGNNQYYGVHISGGAKHSDRWVYVHLLVAECWLGPKPQGFEVDHIDRNKYNNHHSNLRYVTHSVNTLNKDYTTEAYRQGFEQLRKLNCKPVWVDGVEFESRKAAAEYIADRTGCYWRTVCNSLGKKRKYVHGFNIRYSIAETE